MTFNAGEPAPGWHAPETDPALEVALHKASDHYFGAPSVYMGCAAAFRLWSFSQKLPSSQFVVTGVLGPTKRPRAKRVSAHPHGKKGDGLYDQRHLRLGTKVKPVIIDFSRLGEPENVCLTRFAAHTAFRAFGPRHQQSTAGAPRG